MNDAVRNDLPTALSPPAYFDGIRGRTQQRWEQLEQDEELAGPWRQLFSQVQSPRHVVSELLQNADDAGATSVNVRVEGGSFVFEHDGRDFTEDEFASLCRFGFSNKRNLHTIGFRGIGFKSTFSLGGTVEVSTPTLSVQFHKTRFTEPVWAPAANRNSSLTRVSVEIEDSNRAKELAKNFEEWKQSPASLLFFENVRQLDIEGTSIRREDIGEGPVRNSRRIKLVGNEAVEVLLLRSAPESFPDDAVEEIRRERHADDFSLPPCCVEIVLGLRGDQRLFVVLPTGVRPRVPFSCNAPFVQDPARYGIKHPSVSPTNRWLLQRLGRMAAETMALWLNERSFGMEDRAAAYALLPTPPSKDDTLDEDVAGRLAEPFADVASVEPLLLTAEGELALPPRCLAFPEELQQAWTTEQLADIFGKPQHPVLAPQVARPHRSRLSQWNWLQVFERDEIIGRLSFGLKPPKPKTWDGLATLWKYVGSEDRYRRTNEARRRINIIPLQGAAQLGAANDAVRLSGRRSLGTEEDWQFLAKYVQVLDADWAQYLADAAKSSFDPEAEPTLAAAFDLLKQFDLHTATPAEKVIEEAAKSMFRGAAVTISGPVRLAHIAACFNSDVPDSFMYVTRNCELHDVEHGVIADVDHQVEDLFPDEWNDDHILHEKYSRTTTCTPRQWREWALSEHSRLCGFAPFEETIETFWDKSEAEQFLRSKQVEPPATYHYRSGALRIYDYAFWQGMVEHWDRLSDSDEMVWLRVLQLILQSGPHFWTECLSGVAREATRNYERPAQCEDFPAAWVNTLAARKCLPDTYGNPYVPAELFIRTPDTEPLMGIERFVRAELDVEANRPLLRLLGVHDTAIGPDKLVNRIRALSQAPAAPVHEVAKWYESLDKVVARCDPELLAEVKDQFAAEPLILTQSLEWASSGEVFRFSEETFPEAPLIHASVANLPLWGRLGVADRPSAELVLSWLRGSETGAKLDAAAARRVRSCLQAFPVRIWQECKHWISLENAWTPIEQLDLAVRRPPVVRIGDLFPSVRARTADLRPLKPDDQLLEAFQHLRDLDGAIAFGLSHCVTAGDRLPPKPWLQALGAGISRMKLPDEDDQQRVRHFGVQLRSLPWQPVQELRVTPIIDGTPAGQAQSPTALWHEGVLYVHALPAAHVLKAVTDELSRPLGLSMISEAIKLCADRDSSFVTDYLAHNFELEDKPVLAPATAETTETPRPDELQPSEIAPDPTRHSEDSERWDGGEQPGDEPTAEGSDEAPTEELDEVAAGEEFPQESTGLASSRPSSRQRKPDLIAVFADSQRFRWDDEREMYVRPDGSTLRRGDGAFPWELVSLSGETQRRYWLKREQLPRGTEVPAHVWELLRRDPQTSAVLLENEDGSPRELLGSELLQMQERNLLHVYPAAYRIREKEIGDTGGDVAFSPALVSPVKRSPVEEAEVYVPISPIREFSAKGVAASGFYVEGGFVVMQGSKASRETAPSLPEASRRLRESLLRGGQLIEVDGELLFTDDVRFNSPSAAACVVAGASRSGPEAWLGDARFRGTTDRGD